MAQDIALAGATYPSVPAVNLPKSGGGTATFTDVSDTTAAASDVASGKFFYTSDGVRIEGSSSGGSIVDTVTQITGGGDYHAISGAVISGTMSIASNGTYDVSTYATADVNVSSGGGGGDRLYKVTLKLYNTSGAYSSIKFVSGSSSNLTSLYASSAMFAGMTSGVVRYLPYSGDSTYPALLNTESTYYGIFTPYNNSASDFQALDNYSGNATTRKYKIKENVTFQFYANDIS